MDKSNPIKVGEEVYISNPVHSKFGKIGRYAGLADTVAGLEKKYRISFDGDIYRANLGDFQTA